VLSLGAMREAAWSTPLVLGYLGVTALLVWTHRANLRRYAADHPEIADRSRWRPVHYAALATLGLAIVFLLWWPAGALVVAVAFAAACLAAPYFPRWQFFLPIFNRCDGPARAVALTFDDGPDPTTTPDLLELLRRYDAKATFFVVGQKATRHSDLIARIRDAGHAFGNHTESHDVFLMLRSPERIEREIVAGQESLQQLGIETKWMRPPVGITAPRLAPIVRRLGLVCVGFRTRGGDCGNRRVDRLASRLLRRLAPGDIVLLHDVRPRSEAARAQWLREIEQLLLALKERQFTLITLADCLTKKS
jgi:peptidoglycan/xylan/chitin deacetylase (PgdA/CDA1 family)